MKEDILKAFQDSLDIKQALLNDENIQSAIVESVKTILDTYHNGGAVYFCGNGGSAADAQHLAAELSGRFYYDRPPLSSEALHCNTSYLTAVANDYGYDNVYSRLIHGLGRPGDVLIGLSTSGNSPNVVNAMSQARKDGIKTIGFTGAGGGQMKELSDILIAIDSHDTPRIQECHMLIGHTLCQLVEKNYFPK